MLISMDNLYKDLLQLVANLFNRILKDLIQNITALN